MFPFRKPNRGKEESISVSEVAKAILQEVIDSDLKQIARLNSENESNKARLRGQAETINEHKKEINSLKDKVQKQERQIQSLTKAVQEDFAVSDSHFGTRSDDKLDSANKTLQEVREKFPNVQNLNPSTYYPDAPF